MVEFTREELESVEGYLHGCCHLFAVAMHEATGLPLFAATVFDEDVGRTCLTHAWVGWPDGRALDARGLRAVETVLAEYEDCEDISRITVADLCRMGEGRRGIPKRKVAKARVLVAKIHAMVLNGAELVPDLDEAEGFCL